jgi:tellurite resistance protein TehA-like permease
MTTVTAPSATASPRPAPAHPRDLREFGPNWYAAVMGTSITAVAGAGLPGRPGWLHALCTGVWALSALLLLTVLAVRTGHWLRHTDRAREHLADHTVAPFYGCLPMALLSVGTGTLLLGPGVIGTHPAVVADAVLWSLGTASSLLVIVGIPYLMVTRHRIGPDDASPVWLLPLVAPMVAASSGPALVAHLPAGAHQARATLLLACAGMFGASLLCVLVVLPLVWGRLVRHPLPLAVTPALLLVLGPLGQSTTATGNLADAASGALPAYAGALRAFSVLYGLPVMGFALMWLVLSAALLVRAARAGMGFAMTWWAFTFPVGTCVTGATALARHTGVHPVTWLAVALYVLLVAGFLAAAGGTLRSLTAARRPA